MATKGGAERISQALKPSERHEDFEYLVDTLTRMRQPYHPKQSYEHIESIAGLMLCWIAPAKPAAYASAMQRYRLFYRGIVDTPFLQAAFANSVRFAALMVEDEKHIDFKPSLYFQPPAQFPEWF